MVPIWEISLHFLEKISLFYLLRKVLPILRKSYIFVDFWVIGNFLLSICAFITISSTHILSSSIIQYFILFYGLLRVFEIFIYQLNVLLVHPFQTAKTSTYTLHSYRRMTISLIHNFFEIIFWFASTYAILHFSFENSSATNLFYNSFTATVSYTNEILVEKSTIIPTLILQFQALVGLFMTIISLARFVSLFPTPDSLDTKEKKQSHSVNLSSIEAQLEKINRLLENKEK